MRIKVILILLFIGASLVLAAFYFKAGNPNPAAAPATDRSQASVAQPVRKKEFQKIAAAHPAGPSGSAAEQEVEAQKALHELDEIFVAGGEQALPLISAKLSHPDQRVRLAAVTNLVSLDDRNAVTALQQAAQLATDASEKTAMLQAIEFLQLPSGFDLINHPKPPNSGTNASGHLSTISESDILPWRHPTNAPANGIQQKPKVDSP